MHRTLRTFVVRSAVLAAVVSLAPVTGTVTHVTAHAATLPSVSVNDVSTTEGTGGTKTLNFTITQDVRGRSKVTFKTVDGDATSPADYIARTGSVRFVGKKLTRTVGVTIVGDALDEPDETFSLQLTGASGATIADAEGVATITDDDAAPTVSVPTTLSVPEGQTGDTSYASVDVSLSSPSGRDVSVTWTTADGTATVADNDYTSDGGTLHFTPGETHQVVLVAVIGDVNNEADETFTVQLSSPVNASLGTDTDTVTILDNDPLPTSVPIFDVNDVKVREGASGTTTLTFTVTRSDDTATPVTIDYAIEDGTALTPSDYTATTPGTLSFAASETTKTVDVTVNGDRTLEENETLFLTLSNQSAGAILDGQGMGMIVNDDTRTTVAVKVRAAKHRVAVHGRLSPARPRKHMVVKLFRKQNGKWVRIGLKRPTLKGSADLNGDGFTDSRYGTSFGRPKRGSCKAVAAFPGDSKFAGSKKTKLFRC
jgi:Calx-beta domain-containing protein